MAMLTLRNEPQRYQGVFKDSAGYRLLAAMGWKEGQGLGAEGQGIKEHIRVKKQVENWGVGAAQERERAQDWTAGIHDFHRVLSSLSEITSRHAGKDSDSSDEEEVVSPRKQKSKEKEQKKKRKKTREGASDEDATTRKLATHAGRFKKRETAKNVRGYSAEDLTAILGGADPFVTAAAQFSSVSALKKTRSASVSNLTPGDERSGSDASPAPAAPEARPATSEHDTSADVGAWWSSAFHRAGRLGSGKGPAQNSKRGFSENDQEDLYNRTHDAATQGHIGLGISSMPKKVAGARWGGTKTRLDSDDEDLTETEVGAQQDVDASNDEQEAKEIDGGIVIVMPRIRGTRSTAAPSSSGNEQDTGSADVEEKVAVGELGAIKWKRIAMAAIKTGGKSGLKMKKLCGLVMEKAGLDAVHKDAAMTHLLEAVRSSSKIRMESGKIFLS